LHIISCVSNSNAEPNDIPRKLLKTDNIIREVQSSKFDDNFIELSRLVYKNNDNRFTILPSNGTNTSVDKVIYNKTSASLLGVLANTVLLNSNTNFYEDTQNNFRIIWEEEIFKNKFSGATFASPSEYTRLFDSRGTYDNEFGVKYDNNIEFKKVYDLIGTFSPAILDEFEYQFLTFASERISTTSSNPPFKEVYYHNFQDLLKQLVSINKTKITATTIPEQINEIINLQQQNLKTITGNILSKNNLFSSGKKLF
jgi:hypothetical protein